MIANPIHIKTVKDKYPNAITLFNFGHYEIWSGESKDDPEDDERTLGPHGRTEEIAWAEAYLYVLREESF